MVYTSYPRSTYDPGSSQRYSDQQYRSNLRPVRGTRKLNVIVYGASVSYYTGKLETYLRYRGIDYERRSPYPEEKRLAEGVGCIQHPILEDDDGRLMTDTSPILLHLEKEYADNPVLPDDPVMRFIALLIEDYADEWLWRPAMHYRWSYEHDRELLSRILADELLAHLKMPRFFRIRMVKKRQRTGFVINDGVTAETWDHVEQGYHTILALMSGILERRPFLLGSKPSIADFGLMGPMLRHFGQDPTPAEIMRDTAPAVYEWVARMWHIRSSHQQGDWLTDPTDLQQLLQEIVETHLAQLKANALAYASGAKKFSMKVQGCTYQKLPVSRYRVYCLEILRENFASLDESSQSELKTLLGAEAELLWSDTVCAESDYDRERAAPFNRAINVFEDGVPK